MSNGLSINSDNSYINNNTIIQKNKKNKIEVEKTYCILNDINIITYANNIN